jgi:tripartite-type tricarboxylate transporter receptor subunit TctC
VRVIIPYPPPAAPTRWADLFHQAQRGDGPAVRHRQSRRRGRTIAEAAAAKAEPDGYNILYDATAFSVNPFLYSKLSFDYVKDFQPVFLASLVPNLLVVNNSVPAKTVADVIALAKAAPDGLDFASSGNGTLQHLSLEMFRHMTGTKINHIPYRGGGPALNDVIGGQVKFFFSNASASIGQVQGGAVKGDRAHRPGPAAHGARPAAGVRHHPGFRGLRVERRVRADRNACRDRPEAQRRMNAMMKDPVVTDRLDKLNISYRQNTPDDFRAFVVSEMERWGRIVKEANIKLG